MMKDELQENRNRTADEAAGGPALSAPPPAGALPVDDLGRLIAAANNVVMIIEGLRMGSCAAGMDVLTECASYREMVARLKAFRMGGNWGDRMGLMGGMGDQGGGKMGELALGAAPAVLGR
jgi:hypothetical protein